MEKMINLYEYYDDDIEILHDLEEGNRVRGMEDLASFDFTNGDNF